MNGFKWFHRAACVGALLFLAGNVGAETPDSFVEYVETAGAAYVDTGIYPVPATFRATVALASTKYYHNGYFGVKNSSWASTDSIYIYYGNDVFRLDWVGSQYKTFKPVLNQVYRFDCYNKYVVVDGNYYEGSGSKTSTASPRTFWLLGANNCDFPCAQRCYGAQLYADGKTLTANYLPCVKGGVAGLYDTVSGTILYSANSTALTAGPTLPSTSKVFVGTVDQNWSTAGNWSPAEVPGAEDDVVIPGGRTVFAPQSLAVKSLTVSAGAALFVGCRYDYYCSIDKIFPTADSGACSLSTTGNLTLDGMFAIGGTTNVYDSVTMNVGGDFSSSGRAAIYLFASYGDTSKAWNDFTWSDFRTGGGSLTVAGTTTISGSAVVRPVCNIKSGLPFVFNLQDVTIGASATINADNLGWGKFDGVFYGKGAHSSYGGGYGGRGGWGGGSTYGWANAPYYPGSPGASGDRGGGAIRIAARDITLAGTLTARASNQGSTRGSGGGIFLTYRACTMESTALLNAKGGDNTGNDAIYYSGGGGRIALVAGAPSAAQIVALYETGTADNVQVTCSSLTTDSAQPYLTSNFNVLGGHQACYATNPTHWGHGKDGTAVLLAVRAADEVFVTVTSDRMPVTTTPPVGMALYKAGDVSFSFPESVADANDPAIRYAFTKVTVSTNDVEVETITERSFTRNVTNNTVFAANYGTVQYRCQLRSGGLLDEATTWVTADGSWNLTATELPGYAFAGWRGAVAKADQLKTSISLTVDHPLSVAAVYTNTTSAVLNANAWTGSGDGTSWEDGENWSLKRVPRVEDAVTLPGTANVLVGDIAVMGSLSLEAGAWLRVASVGTSIGSANSQLPVTEASRNALGLYVKGDCTIAGAKMVLGGFRNYADDVRLEVGGNLTLSGAAALVVNARYGAASKAAKAWKTFTYADFQAGGASVVVKGATTLSDTAVIYPTCNSRSGLSPVFELGTLTVGAGTFFDASCRGWGYVLADITHYGYGYMDSKGGAYAGKGGAHNLVSGAKNGNTYGAANVLAPFWPGSPGASGTSCNENNVAGAGAIVIRCTDFTLNGTLKAAGATWGDSKYDQGSGGSIFVVCDTFTPGASSVVSVNGGYYPNYDCGCGSGGRISFITGGLTQEQLDDLYETGNCENVLLLIDDPANATDKTIYPNTINVLGGHGPKWNTNKNHAEHGEDGTFRWLKNRGNKVLLTIEAGLSTVTVVPKAGTESVDRGEITFTAPVQASDPEYPIGGRYTLLGLVSSNATQMVTNKLTEGSVTLDIQEDTWVWWLWGEHEYKLDLQTLGPGTTAGNDWYVVGAGIVLTAQPNEGATFAYWAGDVDERDRTRTSINVTLDRPKRLYAVYARSESVKAVWKGNSKGSWFDPENWWDGIVPTAKDDTVMTNGTAFVSDSAALALKSLTLTGAAKLFVGCTGTTVQAAIPFDSTLTNSWRMTVSGAFTVANGAQFGIGGRKGIAESYVTAGSMAVTNGGIVALYAGERGLASELATFKDGGARLTVAGSLAIDGAKTVVEVFNHYKTGAPVIISAGTFALTGKATVDANYNGWGRLERYVSGTWSPVVYGLGVPSNYNETGRAGGCYGGMGGLAAGTTVYGYENAPFYPGSPARDLDAGTHNEQAGGLIRLAITGRAVVDGTLTACGYQAWTSSVGGASGGGIWLTASKVKFGSNAKLQAYGGCGTNYKNSSGGGGGRIAIGVRLNAERLDALYATGQAAQTTVSPLKDNVKYAVSFNVDGGTCPSYREGSKDGGVGTAVVVEGPPLGLMLILK